MARTENIARMRARPHSSGNGSGPPVVSNVGTRPRPRKPPLASQASDCKWNLFVKRQSAANPREVLWYKYPGCQQSFSNWNLNGIFIFYSTRTSEWRAVSKQRLGDSGTDVSAPLCPAKAQAESGGIVLAAKCWTASAQSRCYPTGRCSYRLSVTC
jgi:hypothetical protein